MPSIVLPLREIENALLRKGFKKKEGDHTRFLYPDSLISTKISQGSGVEIDIFIIKKMAKQTHLTRHEFVDLVKCTISGEDYRTRMEREGLINPPPSPPPPLKKDVKKKNAKKKGKRG